MKRILIGIFIILLRVYEIGDGSCASFIGFIGEEPYCRNSIKKAEFWKPYDYIRYGSYQSQYWMEVWTDYPENGGKLIIRTILNEKTE